MFREEVLVINY